MIFDDDGTMSTYQSNHSVLFVFLDAHINLILASFGIFQATVLEIAHELIHVKFCSSVLEFAICIKITRGSPHWKSEISYVVPF